MATARIIVLTGATSGMGKQAAKALARRGACLVLNSRSRSRCEAVKAECVRESGNHQVHYVVGDLSTVAEVRRVAAEIRQRFDRVDTLVNNAGGAFPKQRTVTGDGFELAFVLQYLSRFLMTQELLDQLRASDNARVMTVAGGGSYAKNLDLDDLQSERDYGWMRVIAKTATLNDLITREQAARYEGIGFYNYGPGLVRTNTTMNTRMARIVFGTIGRLFSRSPEQAGADIARLAVDDHQPDFYGPNL